MCVYGDGSGGAGILRCHKKRPLSGSELADGPCLSGACVHGRGRWLRCVPPGAVGGGPGSGCLASLLGWFLLALAFLALELGQFLPDGSGHGSSWSWCASACIVPQLQGHAVAMACDTPGSDAVAGRSSIPPGRPATIEVKEGQAMAEEFPPAAVPAAHNVIGAPAPPSGVHVPLEPHAVITMVGALDHPAPTSVPADNIHGTPGDA
jgi:hypothetical protein